MPALQLLLRRTIASTTAATSTSTANPSSILSSPSPFPKHPLPHTTVYNIPTSPKKRGACYKVACAHVNNPLLTSKTKPKPIIREATNNNNNIYRKRVFMLSSSSAPPPSHCSSFSIKSGSGGENNNNNNRVSFPSATQMGYQNNNNSVRDDDDNDKKDKDHCYNTTFLTLPTVLTLARVAAIPVFIATFYVNSWWGAAATTSLFVAAAITDWLDGYLARKMRLGSAFGAFLDPVADKLMVAATLVLLCSKPLQCDIVGDLPWLFPVPAIAIIGREITMSAVREWAASQDTKLLQAVAVNNLGKWKTATQMTALTIILAARDSNVVASQGVLATSGVALLYISAGLAVWSLVVYMKKIWKVLLR